MKNPRASNMIAQIYREGGCVEKSDEDAERWAAQVRKKAA